MAITKRTIKYQQGAVLIVSLVFLIALTAVAAALMQNSSTDMKMSGASQEKLVATEEAVSATDEVIFTQVQKTNGNNGFSSPIAQFPMNIAINNVTNANSTISVANANNLEVDCPHSNLPSSNEAFKCNLLRVVVTKTYGNNNNSNVQINTGVAQQLLNIGG